MNATSRRHLGGIEQSVEQRAHGARDEGGVGGAVALENTDDKNNSAFTDVPAHAAR